MVSIYEFVSFFYVQYCVLSGSWSQPSSSALGESFHLAPFSLKCKSCCCVWYIELCSRWHLLSYFSSGTLSSHLFGPTKFTMCTASWCWSWSSYASWPCVSPSCAHTSCSTLRTTDGECCHEIKCLSAEKTHGLWTLWFCLLYSRQWTSFLSAASTAVYVYMYSFYYYFFKTK